MKILDKDWFIAGGLLFYYFASASLLMLVYALFFRFYVFPTILGKIGYDIYIVEIILIVIIAVKIAEFLTRQTFSFKAKSNNKVILLTILFNATIVYGLVLQGYIREIEANYLEVFTRTTFRIIIFSLSVYVFWSGKITKLVPRFLKF